MRDQREEGGKASGLAGQDPPRLEQTVMLKSA